MASYPRRLRGEFSRLDIANGDHTHVSGVVSGASVRAATVLSVYGVLAEDIAVEYGGTLLLAGTLTGTLTISEGGKAVVQGALLGEVRNSGQVVLDGPAVGGTVTGPGTTLDIDELAPDLRAQLPTLTWELKRS